jgi:hypothetical protein
MKIGIIGTDQLSHLITDLIKNIDGLEITGCYDSDYTLTKEFASLHQIVPYPTLEAFFRYVDAVVINLNPNDSHSVIENCLKHFKHLFLTGAQYLSYENYLRIEKIAEESNVKFYPEFGINIESNLHDIAKKCNDLLFININHTYTTCQAIYMNGLLPALILQDINLVLSINQANVKKINANGWSLNQQGIGILNAKLDFDNGTSSNLFILNSGHNEELKALLYYKSEIIQVDSVNDSVKITIKDYNDNQLDSFCHTLTRKDSLLHEIKHFQLFVQNQMTTTTGNKYKSIKVSHLIREKINHLTHSPIFYS